MKNAKKNMIYIDDKIQKVITFQNKEDKVQKDFLIKTLF
jgi:hypothetical protein